MARSVKTEQIEANMQSELAKRDVLRLNNQASNQLTRECICMAMMYLMNEKPFEAISISELSKRAGVSRTAFYRNYSTKEDVVKEIGKQLIEKLAEEIDKVKTSKDIHGTLVEFFSKIEDQKDKVELLLKGDISLKLLFPNARIFENVIPASSRHEHYRMVAIDSALIGLVREWISSGCDLTPEELAQVVESGIEENSKLRKP
ncbi:MAG: TetR/AcrR family transcriptional regulator [Saccharofermentans sp.]|nr:TetR/AcrR family transcriptional regulator [Saccharofermentans sp.]